MDHDLGISVGRSAYSQREHLPFASTAFQGELIVAGFETAHINHGFERCNVGSDLSGASCCSPGTQVGIENSNVVFNIVSDGDLKDAARRLEGHPRPAMSATRSKS